MTAMPRKGTPLENVLGRIDDLDSTSLAILVGRLARERHLLETVVNTIREGIVVMHDGGLIEYANEAAARLLGFSTREVGRAVLWKLVPELTRSLHLSPRGRFSETSVITRELEVAYPEPRFLRLTLVPLEIDSSSEPQERPHYCVVIADHTGDQARTRERIESERITSVLNLAAGVAHELGNPLNSLTIHLQVLQRQLRLIEGRPETGKIERSVNACLNEVQRLDGIVRHFLEAVRPTPPDLREVDLVAVVEDVLEFVGPEVAAADITVDFSVGDRPPAIMADPNQLRQVLFNVFRNAREAMEGRDDHARTIHLRTRTDDDFVHLLIGDTGSGIAPEHLGRLYEPYFTTKQGGHGLGMMIVQRIMRDHGGRIGIDSRPGVGTVVDLQFPRPHRRVRLLES